MFTVTLEVSGLNEMRLGVLDYEQRVLRAVEEIAGLLTSKLEATAKKNAGWKDDTGAARAGLQADWQWETVVSSTEYSVAGRIVAIYLTHGYEPDIFYGIFLELARGQKYAVIMPTIYSFLSEIESLLQGIFAG